MRSDRRCLYAVAGLRAMAVGLCGVILALHLAVLRFDVAAIGLAVSLGLAGCALGTAVVTHVADRFGRRQTLLCVIALMACGGVALAHAATPAVILASALLGMVNGMGRDRGAGLTVEMACLPQITTAAERTTAFAWYNLATDGGHALGALLAGVPAWLRAHAHATPLASYQWTWYLYSGLCLSAGLLTLGLSVAVERNTAVAVAPLSPPSRRIITRFAALSGLDSLGGGFLTTALLSYWFFQRFGVDETVLAPLFFVSRVANGLSHLAAAWLARRIGLVKTMVFAHLPSSLLLFTVAWAPNLWVAVALFLLRESLVEMDVPTRQSYLMAVVREDERTRAAGITNLTRSVAWAVAPALAGAAMRVLSLSAPLLIGPSIKIAYDLALYRCFRHLVPPEESA